MKFILLFILAISLYTRDAQASSCAHLLRELLQREVLTEEQVQQILKTPQFINPMDLAQGHITDSERHVLRKSFEAIAKDPKEFDREKIAEDLARDQETRIQSRLQNRQQRVQSKQVTVDVVYPSLKYWLPSRFNARGGAPLTSAVINGEPMILGAGYLWQPMAMAYSLDPLQKKLVEMKKPFPAKLNGDVEKIFSAQHFYYGGRDFFYFQRGNENIFSDLKLGEYVQSQPANLELKKGRPIGTYIYSDSENIRALRFILRVLNPNTLSQEHRVTLVESDLLHSGVKPKELARFDAINFGGSNIFTSSEGSTLLSYFHASTNQIFVYDMKNQKSFPIIKPKDISLGTGMKYATVYERDGALEVIFPYIRGYAIADVSTGEIRKSVEVKGDDSFSLYRLNVVETDGEPMAYGIANKVILQVNLKTGKYKKIKIAGTPHVLSDFTFKNTNYLVWATWEGDIEIYNPADKVLKGTLRLRTEDINQILPFYKEGRVYAVVAYEDRTPAIIQLAGPLSLTLEP